MHFRKTLTEDKGIHDDTRDGHSHHEAKGNVDVEIGRISSTDPKNGLDRQTDENDDPPTVPGEERNDILHFIIF